MAARPVPATSPGRDGAGALVWLLLFVILLVGVALTTLVWKPWQSEEEFPFHAPPAPAWASLPMVSTQTADRGHVQMRITVGMDNDELAREVMLHARGLQSVLAQEVGKTRLRDVWSDGRMDDFLYDVEVAFDDYLVSHELPETRLVALQELLITP